MKRYLLTPGPTPVPPEVLAAIGAPVVHHRSPDFRPVWTETLERLQSVCRTSGDVLLFASSGTGAFESAVANLLSPGDRVLSVSAGAFGERWTAMARAFGLDVQELRYEWGETPSADDLRPRLAELGGAAAVFLVHSETSTGVVADVQALAASAKEAGALAVVDAVSSLGAVPLETQTWGLDVVVSGSQKALMTPPGLGVAAVSDAAWARAETATLPRFYFDWRKVRAAQEKQDSLWTPPVSLVAGLNVALGILLAEGMEDAWARHVRLGRACREGVKAMGLELFSPDADRSAVVTAVRAPEGVDAAVVYRELRDRFGITIAAGHGPLRSRVFRIGHIGWFDVFDITTALGALELVLADLGAEIERGAAVTRALEAWEEPVAV